MKPVELTAEDLVCSCSDEETLLADAIPDAPPTLPGQKRGLEAIEFGITIKKRWFNITVTGAPGSGKSSTTHQIVLERAQKEPRGKDICIYPNYANPDQPGILFLPPGEGKYLNRLIDELLRLLDKQIPHLLEQPAVKTQLQEIASKYDEQEKELSRSVEKFAEDKGIVLQTTPQGINMIPLSNGKPMTEEDFLSISVEERTKIDERRKEVLEKLGEINPQILTLEKEKRETTEKFAENLVRDLVKRYAMDMRSLLHEPTPELLAFLDNLEEELVAKRFLFFGDAASTQPFGGAQLHVMRQQFAKGCRLNVVVDRTQQQHAPVVVDNNPTYSNLIGGVDFEEDHGVLKADFSQVRAGSLLQASGGYLILQATDLVQNPLAYYALKRALRNGKVTLRDQFSELGWRSATHLEPDPVPFNTKVIVVGEEWLVQMIQSVDEDFARLFRIHADFSRNLERTPEVMSQYARYVQYNARQHGLLPISQSGMARLMEEASRTVGHQNRINAQINDLLDILIEADMLAREENREQLERDMVEQALALKKHRHSKIEEMVKREISEGTILLDFDGEREGQVNGLAVYQVGRVAFGVPTRITAQAYAGRSGLINIEREADLSGRIHTKGMLILNGYLGKLFARKSPLSLSVSICFEQNYGGIEGDSATAAEFFVTVSAIAQVPLRQYIAVTGSMNQHGEIQPIGGVNEKISGFFQFAKEHDFPEGCGVMIPAVNKVNLMLDSEIVEAVREGKFHIYPVERIEQGLELMTGQPVGELGPEGTYPPDTVFGKAMANLEEFSHHARKQTPEGKEDSLRSKEPGVEKDSPPTEKTMPSPG